MSETLPRDLLYQVVGYLKTAKRVLFITGAGLSADSGMPTYRGVGGLYGDLPVRDDLTIEDLLSGYMMRTQPALVWEYLAQLVTAFHNAEPNRGHYVMAELEARLPAVWVLTQNVDGLHTRAGSQNVIDIHGDIHDLLCPQCGLRKEQQALKTLTLPPYCESCQSMLRPDVVLFGEMLPVAKLAKLQELYREGFDLVFSVGTSSLFPYITDPVVQLGRAGAKTVEINPGETDISRMVDVRIKAQAAPVLQSLWEMYDRQSG